QKEAFAATSNSIGSFNTFRHNVEMGTGLLKDKFSFYGRLSKITSDGYIDKASVDLKSFFLSGTYTGKAGNFTTNIFSGKEITFQAWNGVPEEFIKEGRRTYNELAKYDNEIDNYQQDHYQLLYDKQLSKQWKLNTALFYTEGRGYFEQYKENEKLSKYNMPNVVVGNEVIKRSDIIRRRWLDNDFYGMIFSTNYTSEKKRAESAVLELNIGGGYNIYTGKHFGEVIWAQFMGKTPIRHRYYDNDAKKTDYNLYTKANYQLYDNLFAFADLQVRGISYNFQGLASDANSNIFPVRQKVNLTFFNPKTGISYRLDNQEWYATYGLANKEPNRDDFTNSSTKSRPKHETLHNVELGYGRTWKKLAINVNLYWMQYKNQLILTGQINDVGAYTRTNVPESYRRGLELQAKWIISQKLSWEGNATFSQNKIKNFVEYLDDYDNGGQVVIKHGTTNIALSPNTLAASQLHFTPFKGMELSLLSKYVGKQYLDNTSSETRKINPYHTHDIRVRYSFQPKNFKEIQIGFLLNNALNRLYESNGYTFGWIYEGKKTYQNYFYPQAGRNWLMTVNIKI
ncbi:MAG: TonB-dependent receptor, partial [Flammeovirgaceae bacterium]|nr:TonB-dependent receptor [Flammeovirgaceae bacterium]